MDHLDDWEVFTEEDEEKMDNHVKKIINENKEKF